jgi:hypothetical protein
MESNYIKRLQNETAVQQREIAALYEGLTELAVYLTSDKFANDPTVQTQDVLNRIAGIKTFAYNQDAH